MDDIQDSNFIAPLSPQVGYKSIPYRSIVTVYEASGLDILVVTHLWNDSHAYRKIYVQATFKKKMCNNIPRKWSGIKCPIIFIQIFTYQNNEGSSNSEAHLIKIDKLIPAWISNYIHHDLRDELMCLGRR